MDVEFAADLRFSVELPGQTPISGTITGSGSRLEVRLADPASFAGRRDAASLRGFAAALASWGVTVVVIAGDVVLLEVGRTDGAWWQRRITGSPNLKIVSLRGALVGAGGRIRRAATVLPTRALVPPATMLPIAPTLGRTHRPATTTHDPRRGGNPRLALTVGNSRLPEDRRIVFPLRKDATTIGSDEACDIRLQGLDPVHAMVFHDDADELILIDRSGDRSTSVNGVPVGTGRALRTGHRISVGEWTFAYRRAEYADHGRPYGGRIGGELGHQRSQPDPRPRRRATQETS